MISIQWFNYKDFISFFGGNLFFQFSAIVCELIILKLVTVNQIGLWQFALLLQGYFIISRLGIINAFNLEYPLALGKNKVLKINNLKKTVNAHVILSSLFQFFAFIFSSTYFFYIKKIELAFLLLGMSLYTICEAIANLEESKKRSELEFDLVSKARAIGAIILFASLILPMNYDLQGLLFRAIFIQLYFIFFYRFLDNNFSFDISFNKQTWLNLFRIGWKLWLWSYLKNFGKSLPRLYIISFLGATSLGYFTPVQWILSMFILLTSSLSSYLYPNLVHLVAKNENQITLKTVKVVMLTIIFLIPFAIVCYFLIPLVFENLYPEYNQSINAIKIIIWASILEISTIIVSSWVSQKKWVLMFFYVITALIIRFAGMLYPFFTKNATITDVSVGILLSSIGIFILILAMVMQELNIERQQKFIKNEI